MASYIPEESWYSSRMEVAAVGQIRVSKLGLGLDLSNAGDDANRNRKPAVVFSCQI